ncbi:serine hydrolase [Rhodoferax aquaticus]|uniref:Peptidase S11 n=1 Tax=Rhodoferax aquaticus TaxID=2527691 RepID=A0A515ELG9_9BURK|nr:serine hydrolase [Rhodoferax aquaticus]QDL53469.1 peptidase S11 [Rhodoferax aquaticus]
MHIHNALLKGLFSLWILASALVASATAELKLNAQHAIAINNETGQVLVEKNADAAVPIASLTKLMTAMVVLDSKAPMGEKINIVEDDIYTFKYSSSRVRVGTTLERAELLRLALMSSDNRAAAALARTYPGGMPAFLAAVRKKMITLGMTHSVIEEPTGLSPNNMSTAQDLAKMAAAAAKYPEIRDITTNKTELFTLNGRPLTFHNTNRLVGATGWEVLMSKTGFTNEAGHCLIMRIKEAGQSATLVLLNTRAITSSVLDAGKIRQLLSQSSQAAAHPR